MGKLYCEGLGRFYRSKFGLDFCTIRYSAVIGPSVKTPGHWCPPMIESAVLGKAFECFVTPDSSQPMDGSPILDIKPYTFNEKILDEIKMPDWMRQIHQEFEDK